MRLRIGTHLFEANGTEITTSTDIFRTEATVPYKRKDMLKVSGFLSNSGTTPQELQDSCSTQMSALISVLAKPYQDIVFLEDDGSESATYLKNAGSVNGVVVTNGPNFPDGISGYTAVQKFDFTAEAEYYLTSNSGVNINTLLLSFTESLSYSGGGPRYIWKESLRGLPQKQLVCLNTLYKVTQSGNSVGLRGYPSPAPPKFPNNLLQAPNIQRTTPRKMGLTNYEAYAISWTYEYASDVPLIGVPTLWKN